MQKFNYTAKDERGKPIKGVMIAEDDAELAKKIANLGYFLINFKVSQERDLAKGKAKMPCLKPKQVLYFTIHLATLIDAGLPLLAGLKDLAREAGDENLQRIIDHLRYQVESGSSLKDALALHPKSFSKLYTAIAGSGEVSGKLAQALNDLSALLQWQMDLKSKIKAAATYPIILFTVMVAAVIVLVVKVIPAFAPIFNQAGVELPLPTQVVLGASSFVQQFWYLIVGAIIILVVGYKLYNATAKGNYRLDSLKLRLPLFGNLLRKVALSRFAHTFCIGFKSGIDLLTCLDIAGETSGNARIQQAIAKTKDSVNTGEGLASSLQATGEFPLMVIRMIGVGEESGSLGTTLSKVTNFYDREVAETIQRIFALIEPIMIVIMGIVVGTIVLSIFLPMFRLVQIISG